MPPLPLDHLNPFRFADGSLVTSPADWPRRRREIADAIIDLQFGGLPPTPASTACQALHVSAVARWAGARFITYRLTTGPDRPFSFLMTLTAPAGPGPFPVIINGDACWRYASDEVVGQILARGFALAQFNRVELAPDNGRSDRDWGLYAVYPEGRFGALAAWAWGYHRCVDALLGLDFIDAKKIAVVGHSRGGKTSLLAGATDERIALVSANNSGCGGAGSYLCQGPDSEAAAHITKGFPYWFNPRLADFAGRERELPFDQHYLKAMAAPRVLLTTEALGDLWANPTGTWQTHRAAREVYRLFNAKENIGIWFRPGEHTHGLSDWRALLEFMDWRLAGKSRPAGFDVNPFPELPAAHSWTA